MAAACKADLLLSLFRLEIIWRVFSVLKIARVTDHPAQVTQVATVDVPRSAAVVWSFMAAPASGTQLMEEVEAAVTFPGSPRGLGEIQVFLQRTSTGRDIDAAEVIEFEEGRRAVTRSLGSTYPSYGVLTVEPLESDSCRLTQEFRVFLPAGIPVAAVRHHRDQLKAALHTQMTRLAQLAPDLPSADEGDDRPTGTPATLPADRPHNANPTDEATALVRTAIEVVRRRRRACLRGAGLAILATGLLVAALAGNSRGFDSYAQPENGTFWILAAATVGAGAALTSVIRLLSATTASGAQWLHRYSASLMLLTPAALILTGRFNAGGDLNDCGTLLDRNHGDVWTAAIASLQHDCDAASRTRLRDVIVWAAAGCLAAVVYSLQLRRRQHA